MENNFDKQKIEDDYSIDDTFDVAFWEELAAEEKKHIDDFKTNLEIVKGKIDYKFSFIKNYIDDDESEYNHHRHEGFVKVELTDHKNGFYPNHKFYKIIDGDGLYYMKQDDNDDNTFHCMVWQTVGSCEDDYSGWLLFPLTDGTYWKISFFE